jgi:hypothetical protein
MQVKEYAAISAALTTASHALVNGRPVVDLKAALVVIGAFVDGATVKVENGTVSIWFLEDTDCTIRTEALVTGDPK